MNIVIADLIILQAKAVAVMFCAGIAVESLWQLKNYAKHTLLRKAKGRILSESVFWICAALIISKFLYYSAFGRIALYSAIGFFAGLLLWKKICCGIIKQVWVEKEEAENLKITARSSISIRPENKGWKKDGQRRQRKKKE